MSSPFYEVVVTFPSQGAFTVRAATTTLSMGYVPDGLTPEQYKKITAEKAAKVKASKTKKRG